MSGKVQYNRTTTMYLSPRHPSKNLIKYWALGGRERINLRNLVPNIVLYHLCGVRKSSCSPCTVQFLADTPRGSIALFLSFPLLILLMLIKSLICGVGVYCIKLSWDYTLLDPTIEFLFNYTSGIITETITRLRPYRIALHLCLRHKTSIITFYLLKFGWPSSRVKLAYLTPLIYWYYSETIAQHQNWTKLKNIMYRQRIKLLRLLRPCWS